MQEDSIESAPEDQHKFATGSSQLSKAPEHKKRFQIQNISAELHSDENLILYEDSSGETKASFFPTHENSLEEGSNMAEKDVIEPVSTKKLVLDRPDSIERETNDGENDSEDEYEKIDAGQIIGLLNRYGTRRNGLNLHALPSHENNEAEHKDNGRCFSKASVQHHLLSPKHCTGSTKKYDKTNEVSMWKHARSLFPAKNYFTQVKQISLMYNAADYEDLKVPSEIKQLFQHITSYMPPPVNNYLDVKLRPFIPEYYPSVGDIDAFIKVIHPKVNDKDLGIKTLDEPNAFQSDPSVLDLRLRAMAKQSSAKAVLVKKVDNVNKNSKVIDNWIKDISDLHRSKPSPSVHYSKSMPDMDSLIQEWPPDVEELLKHCNLPSPQLDCDLNTYVDIVCNLLDIPVYKSRIQSLHVLCTLYATQKHFNSYGPLGQAEDNDLELMPSASSIPLNNHVDRLQLS